MKQGTIPPFAHHGIPAAFLRRGREELYEGHWEEERTLMGMGEKELP